jgi:2-polyprenyl-3-methyl-5-hydroxy-6-metoxy-1,4-benzoquinol methylase
MKITYDNFEKIQISKPIDRLDYISKQCLNARVLDIGCYDETALNKRDLDQWLHSLIGRFAKSVIGIDNSAKLPNNGCVTGANSLIKKGDARYLDACGINKDEIDIIVAGEFIEHIDNPLEFLRHLKINHSGARLLISTPNGLSFSNTVMALIGREVQHPDHLFNSTFKTLNTLFIRAEIADFEIKPYRFYASEMILKSKGLKRIFVRLVQFCIRQVEKIFPLVSFGYIVDAKL